MAVTRRNNQISKPTSINQNDYWQIAGELTMSGWEGSPSIAQIIGDNENLSYIKAFCEYAEFMESFSNPNASYTLFLPDNSSIQLEGKFLKSITDAEGVDVIKDLLKNHVFDGVITPDILNQIRTVNITSINSSSFTIIEKNIDGFTKKILQWQIDNVIKEAQIKTPQGIKANNGIIFVIDHMLY